MKARTLCVAIAWVLYTPGIILPCSLPRPPDSREMVAGADLIVRVKAVEYSGPPGRNGTTGVPESDVRFSIEEIVKGTYEKRDIVLPGYLSETDDWNDQNPPYTFVRPGGRSGSCFANTYRRGGQFLLVLKKWGALPSVALAGRPAGGYTVNWYALGPVNEQLRSSDDPWVQWVRTQVRAR
jgi:hypothetical protein